MTVDIAAQQAALLQAAVLGLAAGLLYDLFRILRCRVRLPLLGPALDLLFWLVLTGVLFSGPSGPGAARCGCTGWCFSFWAG